MPSPTVAVVIPAINEARSIARAVMSAWDAKADEVVVVDGGSRDDTGPIARGAGAFVVGSSPGRGLQQRCGVHSTRSDVLLFLHADAWIDPSAIAQIRAATQVSVQCGAFHQRIEATGWQFRCLEFGNAWRVGLWGLAYGDQGIFVERRLLEKVGGFPVESLLEDYILMRRLGKLSRPRLLSGPIHVDARRWRAEGVIRRTLRNWWIVAAYRMGVPPERLAAAYRRHDSNA